MLKAFESLGVEVIRCDGDSRQRRATWADALKGDRECLGVYSELSTVPVALTDPDRMPRRPLMDFNAFRAVRKRGWAVSAYYRDIHWRFPFYRERMGGQRFLTVPLYRFEWWQLQRSIDHLFLPSTEMFSWFPGRFPRQRVSALPPGVDESLLPARWTPRRGVVRALYVGGIRPPIYDLRRCFAVLHEVDGVTLDICCREAEWGVLAADYALSEDTAVHHVSGSELAGLYAGADVFCFVAEPFIYHDFAMSVKLFETIGYGVPPIVRADSAVGRFVERNGVGWIVSNWEELRQLLRFLRDDPQEIARKRQKLLKVREHHTWRQRAIEVLEVLKRYRKGSADVNAKP